MNDFTYRLRKVTPGVQVTREYEVIADGVVVGCVRKSSNDGFWRAYPKGSVVGSPPVLLRHRAIDRLI